MNNKAILLLSGGLDSVTLLYNIKACEMDVHALIFDYKQRHAGELQFAKAHAKRVGIKWTVMDLPQLGGLTEQSWIVPNRNMIFLSVAVNIASQEGAGSVYIGCNMDDSEMFPDCRWEFIDAMNAAVKEAGYNVEICAPFLRMRKWQIFGIAKEWGINSSEIWTCYKGGAEHCGECPACKKLKEAVCGQ